VQPTAQRSAPVRVESDPGQAFIAALWDEHGGALLGYVTRLVGDVGRAEDIVQEVMLRAWRHAGDLDAGTRSLRPWLFTVAGNLATDHHRARRSRPEVVGTEALESLAVGDGIDRAVDAWEVSAAFRALSPEHRGVLMEIYYRGRSVAEAAAALGIPAGTVKSRSYYALRALRLALEERGWRP
jgi:RNA polymerase sigma-70 factor (ECF subfamily)